ncbi:MAG TPA: hypothetical protein VJ945_00965 [Flavobacteriaceae bacterium]|nr:hypothetical protein [Flavobacteriaceae bacterium]
MIKLEDFFENIDKDKLKQFGHPLEVFLEDTKTYHDILEISMKGLSMTQAMPKAIDAIIKATGDSEELQNSKENISRIASVAKNEIENGFPFLHNQATLILYSQLEGAVKRLIINFFGIEGSLKYVKELDKIKITISEYYNLDEIEKLEYLFQQYEKSISIGMQYGVSRFETLLNPIGFAGPVSESIKKDIFELSQIRNVIIHRGGIIDKYFANSCPWLDNKIGDKIKVSSLQYQKYFNSVMDYVITLIIRIGEKRGVDMEEFKQN